MSPAARFLDTGYWLALIDQDDHYHVRATRLARELPGPFVTTEAIIVEVGNALATQRWRTRAITFFERVRAASGIDVVPVTSALLTRAIDFYAMRRDKEWWLTDCISFVVMQDRGITEALAADQHFIQAGFRALLREG